MEGEARVEVSGDRWTVAGPLTMDSAATVLDASTALALPQVAIIDLEHVGRVDSAGVAVLLAWGRRAAAEGKSLTFTGMPRSLTSLGELYGVEDFLTR